MKKIIGMGNALVDILIPLEDDLLLEQFNLPKGSMQLIDSEKAKIINSAASRLSKTIATGGSASNTIYGIAQLGASAGFIGKIGKDEHGMLFHNDHKNNGIEPILISSDSMSGFATALISKDGERTFATFLGAASELHPDDITDSLFQGYHFLHIEGYLVQNRELIEKAVSLAKKNGLTVSLDLASYNVVEENYDFLHDLIENYVDIVFANEEEAKSFTKKMPVDALRDIAKKTKIAVVKIGADGSWIKSGSDEIYIPAHNDVVCRDTTGAGDLYAAGFLYGLSKGYSLEKCGKIGAYLASHVIEVIGAKFDEEGWEKMRNNIRKIEKE